MKLIPLTQGKFAMVDDEDFERVKQHNWHAAKNRKSWVARRSWSDGTYENLQHFIMGTKTMLDHKDRNSLNNQKSNLRVANHTQNAANRPKRSDSTYFKSTSKFKGVKYSKRTPGHKKVWMARIGGKFGRIQMCFKTEIEAAMAYDKMAVEKYGEFALTNKQLGLL